MHSVDICKVSVVILYLCSRVYHLLRPHGCISPLYKLQVDVGKTASHEAIGLSRST